jgi:hypothetical protein
MSKLFCGSASNGRKFCIKQPFQIVGSVERRSPGSALGNAALAVLTLGYTAVNKPYCATVQGTLDTNEEYNQIRNDFRAYSLRAHSVWVQLYRCERYGYGKFGLFLANFFESLITRDCKDYCHFDISRSIREDSWKAEYRQLVIDNIEKQEDALRDCIDKHSRDEASKQNNSQSVSPENQPEPKDRSREDIDKNNSIIRNFSDGRTSS